MKNVLIFFIVSAFLIPAGHALGASEAFVSHSLTGYAAGVDSVTLDYSLRVENRGDEVLTGLVLSYVPLRLITDDQITLNVGDLEPGLSVDISFSIVSGIIIDQSDASEMTLHWAAWKNDSTGAVVEFPAKSCKTEEEVNGGAE